LAPSTSIAIVIAQVCHPLARQPPEMREGRRLVVQVERLRVVSARKRHHFLAVT
jgi:hypothetical protein